MGELNKLIKEVVFTIIKEGKVKDFIDKSRDFINKSIDTYDELKNRDFKSSSKSKEEFKIKATSSDLRNTDFRAYVGKFPYQAYINQNKTKVRVSFDPSKVSKAFANRITNRDRKDSFYSNFVSYDDNTAILEFPIKESVMVPTPIPYKGYQCDKQGKLIKDTEESILDLQTTDDKDIVEESILDLELSGVKFKNPEISDIIETEDISRNEDSDEVIKSVLTDVKKEISDTESEEYINKVEDELHKKGISVDADHLGSLVSESVLGESKEILSESTDDGELEEKYLTLRVLDPESTIENLLNHIKTLASSGHSFNVSVDSVNDERHQDFFIDGDGCDKIYSIEVSEKKVVEESKNLFKDKHICDGCGKPLSQCTCEIKEESIFDDYDEDDSSVAPGNTFVEDGVEYKWIQSHDDIVHIDFDSWQVWEASDVDASEDDAESQFFVVDIDTGFIDWGPVDTVEEALSFLKSKQTDEELDECTQVSNIGQHKSSSIDLVEDNSSDLNKELELEPDDILVNKNGDRYKILKPLDGQVKVFNLTSNIVSYISNDYLTSDNFKIESDDT